MEVVRGCYLVWQGFEVIPGPSRLKNFCQKDPNSDFFAEFRSKLTQNSAECFHFKITSEHKKPQNSKIRLTPEVVQGHEVVRELKLVWGFEVVLRPSSQIRFKIRQTQNGGHVLTGRETANVGLQMDVVWGRLEAVGRLAVVEFVQELSNFDCFILQIAQHTAKWRRIFNHQIWRI